VDDWHVAIAQFGRFSHAAEALEPLGCVSEICAPMRLEKALVRGRGVERKSAWLGSLILARWETADPYAWHDVNGLRDVRAIMGGWPPAVVANAAIERFLEQVRASSGWGAGEGARR
jgi:hypothetical protein